MLIRHETRYKLAALTAELWGPAHVEQRHARRSPIWTHSLRSHGQVGGYRRVRAISERIGERFRLYGADISSIVGM